MHFPFKYVYRETRKFRFMNNIRIFAHQHTDQHFIALRMSNRQPRTPPLVADQTMPDFVFSRVYAILFQDQRKPYDVYGPFDG